MKIDLSERKTTARHQQKQTHTHCQKAQAIARGENQVEATALQAHPTTDVEARDLAKGL